VLPFSEEVLDSIDSHVLKHSDQHADFVLFLVSSDFQVKEGISHSLFQHPRKDLIDSVFAMLFPLQESLLEGLS